MAHRIRRLAKKTANRIAAGEVVERPASVVKELLENAVDAGAGRIQILIRDGGRRLIEVRDDGEGIHQDDLPLAVQRHATSKIREIEDLNRIDSLGFRGEALASIGSVARLQIVSRPRNGGGSGARITAGDEGLEGPEPHASPLGTRVRVEDLFHNTPAREKQLKPPAIEFSHIARVVYRQALAHPEIAFQLIHNDQLVARTSGLGDLKTTAAELFGSDYADRLLFFEAEAAETCEQGNGDHTGAASKVPLRLTGAVGHPQLTRADRSHQHFFVNRRPVKSVQLHRALEDAFDSLLMVNRHPTAILNVDLPPSAVDVNIHPAKEEVRFTQPSRLSDLLKQAVKRRLDREDLTPEAAAALDPSPQEKTTEGKSGGDNLRLFLREGRRQQPDIAAEGPEEPSYRQADDWKQIQVLGSFARTYVIARRGEELLLVDQHAAQERLFFEDLVRQLKDERREDRLRQGLAVPLTIKLSASEYTLWQANQNLFTAAGFRCEPFGPQTLLVRAVPTLYGGEFQSEAFVDLLAAVSEEGSPVEELNPSERARLITHSCRTSVRAGDWLSRAEQHQLLQDLFEAENPSTCPHGRPTTVKLDRAGLERLFKRRG